MMLSCNCEEYVDALLETPRVLLPQKIVQKNPHGVHPDALGPAKFLIDLPRIETCRLPHLQLVDGIARNIVRAYQPWLLRIPLVRLGLAPWRGRSGGRRLRHCQRRKEKETEKDAKWGNWTTHIFVSDYAITLFM